MKKYLRIVFIIFIILFCAISVYKLSNKYSLNILKNNMDCTIVAKGCEKAKAIAEDDNNIYVAFSDYIKSIDREGKEKVIYKNKDMSIEDMNYYKGNLIYISDDGIYKFSLQDQSLQKLCSNIPLAGNGINRKLLINSETLYIAIGSVTNSGISENEMKDLSPIDVTLNGINYGENSTGAFKKSGIRSEMDERIEASSIGNAAIYSFNLKNKKISLYASGIRGVKGIDFNSKNDVYAIFSGMNNEGLRPVNRDKDYIYKIEEGVWYGWPDYSGADPISSPRFKGEKIIKPLLKNMSDKNVPPPIYQSSSLNSLNAMAIDKNGIILDKDTIVFWNKDKEKICTLSAQGVYKEILKLKSDSNIEKIICSNNGFTMLDNGVGCIYSIHKKVGALGFKLPVVIIFFIFMLAVSLLGIILYKLLKNMK